MSADNGIYILKTRAFSPDPAHDFEYRVAHATCIENLYYDVDTGGHRDQFIPEEAFAYFGKSTGFRFWTTLTRSSKPSPTRI